MRAALVALVLVLLIVTVFPAVPARSSPSGPSLRLEWRIFLGEDARGATPVLTAVFGGHRYAGVVLARGADTLLYIVDLANRSIAKSLTLRGVVPLCADALRDGSLSLVVTPGKSRVEETLVAPDLSVVEGLRHASPRPVIYSGCTHVGLDLVLYGSTVVSGLGLEAFVDLVNPAGSTLAFKYWGGPGDQVLKVAKPLGDGVVAAVSNTSAGTIDLYRVSWSSSSLRVEPLSSAPLRGKLVDAAVTPRGMALLESGDGASLIVYPGEGEHGLPDGIVGLAFVGAPWGLLAVAGSAPNATTGLTDGAIILIEPHSGRPVAVDLAYGRAPVSYTTGTTIGNASILVAGLHGDTPLVALYSVSPPSSGEHASSTSTGSPGGAHARGGEGSTRYAYYVAPLALLTAAVALLFRARKR